MMLEFCKSLCETYVVSSWLISIDSRVRVDLQCFAKVYVLIRKDPGCWVISPDVNASFDCRPTASVAGDPNFQGYMQNRARHIRGFIMQLFLGGARFGVTMRDKNIAKTALRCIFSKLRWVAYRTFVYMVSKAILSLRSGVTDGTRTRNNRNHNPELCHWATVTDLLNEQKNSNSTFVSAKRFFRWSWKRKGSGMLFAHVLLRLWSDWKVQTGRSVYGGRKTTG